jgi:integrase/recombinase XerD
MTTTPSLARYVQAFFADHLTNQRDLSPNTLLSYRDTLKLFLAFAARHHHRLVVDLGFEHVGPQTVLAFLDHLETGRHNSVRTRNARLAALHTFFRYVGGHEPAVVDLCQRISSIPVKKFTPARATYLEYEEVLHILHSIDVSTLTGRRDDLLVRLLFETGARAQEVATLRTLSLHLVPPCQVRLLGKGRKERICPLRATTAQLIRAHLRAQGLAPTDDAPLFVSARGTALTRYGILRAVQRHVQRAAGSKSVLASKRVGAHTFRHTAAISLLRSGNDLSVVRSWLGHVSVTTTDQYTEIDLETKRKALQATEPLPSPRHRSWKKNADLVAWLEAL